MSSIFSVASRISTPLALSGLVMAVLFFIFRQLIAKDIFPKLTAAVGGQLLRQIVDRLFVLALVAMLLGAIGYSLPIVFHIGSKRKAPPSSQKAEQFLTLLYAGDYRAAYDYLATTIKNNLSYVAFIENTKNQMGQFAAPPLYRHLRDTVEAGGLCQLLFDAEFDERSRYREIVTYADTPDGWMLLRYEIAPSDWPVVPTQKLLSETSPGLVFNEIAKMPTAARSKFISTAIANHWLPVAGWSSRVKKVLFHKATRTCDVEFGDTLTGGSVVGKDVLDGCSLQGDTKVILLGQITAADNRSIELSSVRILF